MQVVNKTKNEVISSNIETACSILSRIRGLMLSKPKDLILVSPREDITSSAIHMMFMLYPIDVIWVSSEQMVVDLKKKIPAYNPLKPRTWKTYKPKTAAKYVIELGRGDLGNTEIGDKIRFLHAGSESDTLHHLL